MKCQPMARIWNGWRHFVSNILPLLTPTTLDPAHPFPFFHNQGKGVLFELADTNKKLVHGVILLPENLAACKVAG